MNIKQIPLPVFWPHAPFADNYPHLSAILSSLNTRFL